MEHVVNALVLGNPLHRHNIAGLTHHADEVRVTPAIAAYLARFAFGNVLANATHAQRLARYREGMAKAAHILQRHAQDMKSQPLR